MTPTTSILDRMPPGGDDARIATMLKAHPAFEAAALATARAMVAHFEGHRLLNRVLNDRGRFTMGLAVLNLGLNGVDGGPLTATRFQDFCLRHGICSAGRAKATLAVLRVMRMLEPSPTADRRLKALIPTEAFLALHRERWRKALETLAPIEPRARDVTRILEERPALAAFAATIAGRFESGFRVMALAPALGPAAEHASGLMILLAILADGGPEPGERRLVITGLARRFLVSRGHVLEVLRTAEASGLLAIAGETGAGVTLRPAFRDAFGDFFAGMFAVLLAASANALAAAEARRGAGVSPDRA